MPRQEGPVTPTDAIIEHLSWLRQYRAGEIEIDEGDLDIETRMFEALLRRPAKKEVIGALHDIIFTLAGCSLSDEALDNLRLALNSNFGLNPDLMGDNLGE